MIFTFLVFIFISSFFTLQMAFFQIFFKRDFYWWAYWTAAFGATSSVVFIDYLPILSILLFYIFCGVIGYICYIFDIKIFKMSLKIKLTIYGLIILTSLFSLQIDKSFYYFFVSILTVIPAIRSENENQTI